MWTNIIYSGHQITKAAICKRKFWFNQFNKWRMNLKTLYLSPVSNFAVDTCTWKKESDVNSWYKLVKRNRRIRMTILPYCNITVEIIGSISFHALNPLYIWLLFVCIIMHTNLCYKWLKTKNKGEWIHTNSNEFNSYVLKLKVTTYNYSNSISFLFFYFYF